jgi:DNA topoisomerase-2
MASKQRYVKKDPISHILERPDMYVGSTRTRNIEEFVIDSNYKIEKRTVNYSPAILRIFVEPLSNAVDNVARSKKTKKVTEIRINIDFETGLTTFWNDGEVIPVEKHAEGCYNHSLIFGQLLTGSNYDDEDDREDISGRNGLGIKCTSVFSKMFQVEGVDPTNKKKFVQTWKNNMKIVEEPQVSATKEKKGYTKITYTPDFVQFGIEGYSDDIIGLYKKYVVDASMITKVAFYFNDELVPVSSLQDYAKLYTTEDTEERLYIKSGDCEVLLTPANEFQTISFANGIYTPLGGTHVDAWAEALFRPLVEKLNKKGKPQINIRDVKQFFRLFVVATVKQPEFDSQSKSKLESPNVVAEVKKSHITTISKWSVMEKLEDIIRSKELSILKKVERKSKYIKVDNLSSANFEGTSKSHECGLILVEGLSAKTYATQGITTGAFGKCGRDWWGIYALRGKLLNTRNATPTSIVGNKVVTDIIKGLGLKTGVDYTDDKEFKKLRYGKVLIITDADYDGIHICSLVQNLFHSLFPSLLKRDVPFLTYMQTMIVRVYLNNAKTKSIIFYDENEYRRYVADYTVKFPDKKIIKKYYKGLGTNNDEDVEESFGRKLVQFRLDDGAFDIMNKAFHSKYADMRKEWLKTYDPARTVLHWKGNEHQILDVNIGDYIDNELIKFSQDDCKRSIPNLIDGLKESHRKVLYVAFLRNLKYTGETLKVAQFAGSVAEKSGYHHGEQNMYTTIANLASSYVGSNNVPLFFRDGQFGTRLEGGKDAANARYIFTKLDALTRLIYRPEDEALLEHREDDGDVVEPYFYVPIIPMILVNGNSCGIGTGWSSTIPCYNPLELIACIKVWLENNGNVLINEDGTTISLFPEIIPWYRGYKGLMEKTDEPTKFISHGIIEKSGNKHVITELPIGLWTKKYEEQLDTWVEEKQIAKKVDYSTSKTVHFEVTETDDGFACNEDNMKLTSIIRTSNMCLFDEHENLKKYNNVDEIIDSFCKVRFEFYIKRKKYLLNNFDREICLLGNKKRFLIEVRDGIIKLFEQVNGKNQSRTASDIVAELEKRGYDRIQDNNTGFGDQRSEEDSDDSKGYDYLLRLQIRSITAEKIEKLANDLESKIKDKNRLSNTSEKELWLKDLEEFEQEYPKWLKVIEKEKVKVKDKTKMKK